MLSIPTIPILTLALLFLSCNTPPDAGVMEPSTPESEAQTLPAMKEDTTQLRLFLCGDVMTGRGIDQALPHPGKPRLYESYIKNAKDYLYLAEQVNGDIPTPLPYDYIWGDALPELKKRRPDLKIINLETSVTTSDNYWKNKAVNYRMNPANVACLTAAGIDGCALANNHILDWGYEGLTETLQTLEKAGIKTAGAGENEREAAQPAVWERKNARVLLFSYGATDSGVPQAWEAEDATPGVNLIHEFSSETIRQIKATIEAAKRPGDVVVFSIHWGSNWGYEIPRYHRNFAHRLIDEAGVDVIHGHSSHHFRGIELYHNKLILYGAGDFINDYEGISGQEEYRGDLTLMYFPAVDPANGELLRLELVPLRIKKFRLNYVNEKEALWIQEVLNREGKHLNTSFTMTEGAAGYSYVLAPARDTIIKN